MQISFLSISSITIWLEILYQIKNFSILKCLFMLSPSASSSSISYRMKLLEIHEILLFPYLNFFFSPSNNNIEELNKSPYLYIHLRLIRRCWIEIEKKRKKKKKIYASGKIQLSFSFSRCFLSLLLCWNVYDWSWKKRRKEYTFFFHHHDSLVSVNPSISSFTQFCFYS